MKRTLYKDLVHWKNSPNRKPLILQGARQVGKTWLMKDFGKQEFDNTVYLNFESSERLKNLFSVDFDIQRIITTIEIEVGYKIQADKCLIVFDEIQEAEKGLIALNYFYEQAPDYFIIAAASLFRGVFAKKYFFHRWESRFFADVPDELHRVFRKYWTATTLSPT